MVSLRRALEVLFKDILTPIRLHSDFTISHLKRFWHKQLEELSAEELAYALTIMVYVGENMTPKERQKWRSGFFRKNPIIELIESRERERTQLASLL